MSVSKQYDHFHTILNNPFLSISLSVLVLVSANTPLRLSAKIQFFPADLKPQRDSKILLII